MPSKNLSVIHIYFNIVMLYISILDFIKIDFILENKKRSIYTERDCGLRRSRRNGLNKTN